MNFRLRDNVTNQENMKNEQITKNKRIRNLLVSEPENHNLWHKTATKIEFEISRKEQHSFIADTKQKVDQMKRKMETNFNKPFLF